MNIDFKLFDPNYDDSSSMPKNPCVYMIALREGHSMPCHCTDMHPQFTFYNYADTKLAVLFVGKSKTNLWGLTYKSHFECGRTISSSLHKYIGLLLGYKIKGCNFNNTYFSSEDDKNVSEWMRKNLVILYCYDNTDNIETSELELIKQYNPPLNLKGNNNEVNKEFRKALSDIRVNSSPKKEKAYIDHSGMIVCPKCKTHLVMSDDILNDARIRCSNCETVFDNPVFKTEQNRKREEKQQKREEKQQIIEELKHDTTLPKAVCGVIIFIAILVSFCTGGAVKMDGTTRYVMTRDAIVPADEESAKRFAQRAKLVNEKKYEKLDEDLAVNGGYDMVSFNKGDVIVIERKTSYGYVVRRVSDYQGAIIWSDDMFKEIE